jgi:hypothetical protein
MLAIAISTTAVLGLLAGPALAFAITLIVAVLTFGPVGVGVVVAIEVVAVAAIAIGISTGVLPAPNPADIDFASARVWARSALIAGLMITVCVALVRSAVARLEGALARAAAEVGRRAEAERARTEAHEAMIASQRLEAVAQVAAGIAHDFNNLLAVVGGKAALVARNLPPGSPGREDVDVIADVVAGGAGLTRQLLMFSRRQVVRPVRLGPDERLRGLARLLRTLAGGTTIAWRHEAEDAAIEVDPSQFEQVVINLVLNARDAVREGGGIEISTARVGGDVVVAVRDEGIGMDAATQARAFEPLFTTKPDGMGTGLGLATVRSIARQAGGDATLRSTPGQGTTVEVRFPELAPLAPAPGPATPAAGAAAHRPIVLVIDDEPQLRAAVVRLLDDAGADARDAGDGAAALALAAALERVDAVVSDLAMHPVNGDEAIRRLRVARPGLPAVLVSGFLRPGFDVAGLGEPAVVVLAKPFAPEQLVAALRGALEPSLAATLRDV